MNSYFICATQTSNVGDLIINKMLIDELCLYGKVFVDAYGLPDNFKSVLLRNANTIDVNKEYCCTAKRPSVSNLIKLIRIIKEQHIFQLTQSPGPLLKQPLKTWLGFSLIHFIFKSYGVSIQYYGNCCSSVAVKKQQLNPSLVNKFFLRSYSSIEYAKGFYGDRCNYIPDLAFLLRYHVKSKENDTSNIIAYNVRKGNDVDKLIEKSIELIAYVASQGYEVVLYHQVASDKSIMEDIYEHCEMSNVSMRKEIVWYDDLDFYADKKFVISNRLHSLLAGAAFDAIPIGLIEKNAAQSKIGDVFKSAQLPENNLIPMDAPIKNFKLEAFNFSITDEFQRNAELCRKTIRESINEAK